MPSLADIYSTIDSYKRKLGDVVGNPIGSLQQAYGNANDKARDFNDLTYQASQEKGYGPKNQELARQLAEAYSPAGMTVWHGSPFKFKAFDPIKIGTGEGAQAFGHGLYVAENPKVAKQYAKNVKDMDSIQSYNLRLKQLSKKMDEDSVYPGAYRQFKSDLGKKAAEEYDAVMEMRDQKATDPGNLYKIDLPDEHINKMMDWDKPIGQQVPHVKKAIEKTKSMLPPNAMDDLGGDLSLLYNKDITPEQFLNTWESLTGSRGSGEAALAQHGVPGIKYLDEDSRNTALNPYYKLIRKSDNSVYTQMQDLNKAKQFVNDAKNQGVDFDISEPVDPRTRNFVIFPGHEDKLNIQDMNGNSLQ